MSFGLLCDGAPALADRHDADVSGAQQIAAALADLRAERSATALGVLRDLARQQSPDAQYALGLAHERGWGVPADFGQAARWYLRAAEQGHADAQHNLGTLYGHGSGVPQDFARAVFWCRKAAEQGHALAQAKVGYMYEMGMGVEPDLAQAAYWFGQAARQGTSVAQLNLALLYETGRGLTKDSVEAYRWYTLAARSGPGSTRSRARERLRALMERMTHADIARAESLVAAGLEVNGR